MENDHEEKLCCKVCSKIFTNGRSLGGHMRSHLSLDSSFDAGERAGYGLRENPKKSRRLSDSSSDDCLKHLGRNNGNVDSESQSESEITDVLVLRKRRKLRRVAAICDDSLLVPDSDKEQEDGAMILMMLSRDFNYFDKSSLDLMDVGIDIEKAEKGTDFDVSRNGHPVNLCFGYSDEFKKSSLNYGLSELGRRKRFYQFDPEADGFDDYNAIDPEKRSRYKCRTCNKVFNSYQALGGHRASHNVDRNLGIRTAKRLKKKSKDHECPVCGKAFSSGQALGGHKRSHWAIKQEANSIGLHFQSCNDGDSNTTNVNSDPSGYLWL